MDNMSAEKNKSRKELLFKQQPQQSWIRGVNLGGWLLMERYITPYQFALTTCHVEGDFCWYPGQINAPPNATLCDTDQCKPLLSKNVYGQMDYPFDEYTLWKAFGKNTSLAESWLNHHLENFITEADIKAVRAAGATHVRLPLPHWILQSQEYLVASGEAWIVGKRWEAFQRVVEWCRTYDIQVWPDIHTAPGYQNGFDNSGQQLKSPSCRGWSSHPSNVQMSLQVLQNVTQRIVEDGMDDVVTGIGLLNEPFGDCNIRVYKSFLDQGLDIVRQNMGAQTHVYVGDMFGPGNFNDGTWWLDGSRYNNTYLDSHHYHVFAETMRALTPRQHIALACQDEYHLPQGGVTACCWQDPPNNTIPSQGVKRMFGEWSVATDVLPGDMLYDMLQNVAETGTVLHLDRKLSPERQEFLRNFAQAQMVIYEMQDQPARGGNGNKNTPNLGAAWFYWTLKMEGGAFAEWDFLRGIEEGWLPRIPAPTVSSQSLHGSCYEIMARTNDDPSIISEFPKPDDLTSQWRGPDLDDDVVVSHGDSVLHPERYNFSATQTKTSSPNLATSWMRYTHDISHIWLMGVGLIFIFTVVCICYRRVNGRRNKLGYTPIPQVTV